MKLIDDAIFTRDYWLSEIHVFHARMTAPDLGDDEAARLVSAVCYLANAVVANEPEFKKETLEEFLACYRVAKTRMGKAWIFEHMQIINTHGGPPPGEKDPSPT